MKVLGNDIYIQRGEIWTLDFQVSNEKGDPFMLFKYWQNPYLAITVTAARYEQEGDFRETYWLDLDNEYIEQPDGSVELQEMKRFISTEALPLPGWSIRDAINLYGTSAGGKMVLDPTSDFDITNYLFYVDENNDGNRVYRYLRTYVDNDNDLDEVWEDYDFRVIKSFNTKSWIEQGYLYDMKILSGQTVIERISELIGEDVSNLNDDIVREKIEQIEDEAEREKMRELYDSGAPLMPDYDTRALILQPTNLYVSANIQGGVR